MPLTDNRIFSGSKRLPWWLILALSTPLLSCAMSPYDRKEVDALVNGPDPPVFDTYTAKNRRMHFAAVGAASKRPVVFIHGTPGSWEAFATYLSDVSLRRKARLIAVDRVGFGKSTSEQVVTSLQTQAALVAPLIRRTAEEKGAILVGHSLGAPIAVRLAMDFPELVDPENADFAGRMLDQRAKIVRMPEAGHFILWQAPEVVIAEILALLSRLRCG